MGENRGGEAEVKETWRKRGREKEGERRREEEVCGRTQVGRKGGKGRRERTKKPYFLNQQFHEVVILLERDP